MLTLYFSGTGNSKYIAELFSNKITSECHSIEEALDFSDLIESNDTLTFCYPIYGSCVPKIMRNFVTEHKEAIEKKNIIIFCTQLLFSGDGARAFTDLFENSKPDVIYAEHFNMPNNICNIRILPVAGRKKLDRAIKKSDHKMDQIIRNINNGKVVKRGFNLFSKTLGKSQSAFWPEIEKRYADSIRTDGDCNGCGLCVKLCPTKNLTLVNGKIIQNNKCIICYRCINACPQKSITVGYLKKPRKQYKGLF